MLVRHVALVSEKCKVSASEFSRVAAAIQKQVTRDFAPVWNVKATVDAFHSLDDVPVGYWPVVLKNKVKGAAGYHDNLDDGQPFSLVEFDSDWPLTASHETLEMLADPYGRRVISGMSPDPSQGRVGFLVEVADPCEDTQFAYSVNGIMVSDFYTPDFFEPRKVAGQRYSFTGAITAPRQILQGGYLSWLNPADKQWYQQRWFGTPKPTVVNLGAKQSQGSLRSWIDTQTSQARKEATKKPSLARDKALETRVAVSTKANARSLRRQIAALVGE